MTNNEIKLQELIKKINKKAEKQVIKVIVQSALKMGINVNEVAEKHSHIIKAYRKEFRDKITKEYQKEINALKLEIKREKTPAKKVERKTEHNTRASIKSEPKKKHTPKDKKTELSLIKEMMFGEQLGFREIAKVLGKDEEKVRKIVVKIMCESVA